jgi:peptide-methionine (R)-S-oxide reductase
MSSPAPISPISDAEWRSRLTPEQYRINRQGGTECAFTQELLNEKRPGTFYDVTGEQPLFRSEDKFESGTGWPSFRKPISPDAVVERVEASIGYPRTEVLSTRHGHHLGHVFPDGPGPGGLRYCINAEALKFVPDQENPGQ